MLVQDLPSTNESMPQLQPFNTSTPDHGCYDSPVALHLRFVYICTYLCLVFPLTAIVLCSGFKRWKQRRSTSTAMSHSDFFTYNMAVVELAGVVGAVVGFFSSIMNLPAIKSVGIYIASFPWNAHMMLPTLICIERYLAVVRPITYLKLRQATGIHIRNVATALTWLLCSMWTSSIALFIKYRHLSLLLIGMMVLCLITVTFCSLSILCVLIRRPPGKTAQDRVQIDKTKRRAFKIILVIMMVLILKFGGNMIGYIGNTLPTASQRVWCVAMRSAYWSNLPSSIVLPLLFLNRSSKILRCLCGNKPE
ncbi:uncharacterized protein LOC118561754 [Fundulus heteroclitus]|uniref:uncharacterized protein LOC118561754 n=1 Tax=Fundulus heteroclitus TaxID=8078 RepID=UPI00165CBD28|nr:uncharacterized protein LOC118561754 [Fundulus heteroclitus]XP_035989843.1 uncharacterized protein LOC118561754 [Fundulus heteroclitus]XP_035989844.1 uncharacterized protein LOC118561754 [Fundulus heteroclitus]